MREAKLSLIALATIFLSVFSNAPSVKAQSRRPTNVASLGEMGCTRVTSNSQYQALNEDIPVGRELLRSVARLGNGNIAPGVITRDEPAVVSCRLAPVNSSSNFTNLTLTVGMDERSNNFGDGSLLDGSVIVRLSVYLDGNFSTETTIRRGDLIRIPINVTNSRSISLEGECVRSRTTSRGSLDLCPAIYFFEDALR